MGPIQSLDELIGLLIRRRLLIGAVAVFGTVLTLLHVMSRPDVFESAAVIQVQSPIVTDPISGAQVPSQSAQRLQAIEQRLTTRDNLLAVIDRHGLYQDLALSEDEMIHLLRMSLRFERVASAASPQFGAPPQVAAMIVFAQADTRDRAARIANDFAQSILDAGAEGQTGRARESVQFFSRQLEELRAEIVRTETELAGFKTENAMALPAQRALREQELVGLESDLRAVEQDLSAARSERDTVLARNSQRATDRRQMDVLEEQIARLTAQSAVLQEGRAEIRGLLVQAPEVDRRLLTFERNLSQLQEQFDLTTRRLAEARTAMDVEQHQQGETFALLERAMEPDYPVSGGRRKLALAGGLGSLMLGFGLAFLLDLRRPVLRTRAQVARELDLQPIVAIPPIRGIGRGRRGFLARMLLGSPPAARSALPAPAPATAQPKAMARLFGAAKGHAGLTPIGSGLAGSAVLLLVMIGVAVTT
ncbi:GumC family protein [Szabonella alba]|uniref:Polysaccharide chain length determinant N-terminal domain-containing protein n=1 Tax=Szabonella alba TaxID=2804194 RepID=A0A8K0V9L6_9RHOB|nr:Wzz/FepE/Etk N-terminal domain-containing protein [Szabonella alba]MBL4915905.1 hypothetical protein [Szabonella alba]